MKPLPPPPDVVAPMANAALAVRRYESRVMAAALLRSQRLNRKTPGAGRA